MKRNTIFAVVVYVIVLASFIATVTISTLNNFSTGILIATPICSAFALGLSTANLIYVIIVYKKHIPIQKELEEVSERLKRVADNLSPCNSCERKESKESPSQICDGCTKIIIFGIDEAKGPDYTAGPYSRIHRLGQEGKKDE